jgi:hypothetical protein
VIELDDVAELVEVPTQKAIPMEGLAKLARFLSSF